MFNNPFKRKKKLAPADPHMDIRSQRPSAGEIRASGLNETLFLAPLPVYTGQMQVSSSYFSQMNDTFIELGGSNRGMVEQGKILAAGIWILLFLAFIAPVLICISLVMANPPGMDRKFFDIIGGFIQVFATGALFGLVPLGGYLYGMLSSVFTDAKTYPVRFNRQRREVCYIDAKTHRVLIVPWESVVAWVANTQGVTQYGATRQYTLGMGLEDDERDEVQFLLLPQASDAHSLGLWTAIRNYMEDGQLVDKQDPLSALLNPTPTGDRLKPYEGLHTFEIERDDARWMCAMDDGGAKLSDKEREHFGYPKRTPWPLRWWYVRRVLVFWKMPYMLAEWAYRKGRPVMPEQVEIWSQPLPPQQWAKPSPALLKANKQVKTAMDKNGATFTEACKAAGLH